MAPASKGHANQEMYTVPRKATMWAEKWNIDVNEKKVSHHVVYFPFFLPRMQPWLPVLDFPPEPLFSLWDSFFFLCFSCDYFVLFHLPILLCLFSPCCHQPLIPSAFLGMSASSGKKPKAFQPLLTSACCFRKEDLSITLHMGRWQLCKAVTPSHSPEVRILPFFSALAACG